MMKESIYTLLVIAWIVYSIVKAVSKKKSSENSEQDVKGGSVPLKKPSFSSSIDSLLNAVLDIKQADKGEISIPYMDNTRENPLEKSPNYENYAKENVLDSYSDSDNAASVFAAKETEISSSDDSDKSIGNQNKEEENAPKPQPFDLRQAVINQVILERPY